jgi:hypothetical protein
MVKKSVTIWIYILFLIAASISVYFIIEWRRNRPIIHDFSSSNTWKAFILNSIAASLVIFIAMTTQKSLDKYSGSKVISVVLTLSTTFVTSMVAFSIMFVIFGFGSGMVSRSTETDTDCSGRREKFVQPDKYTEPDTTRLR